MARYLLVRVDDKDKSETIRARLDGVEGVKTVGAYAIPTDFCTCRQGLNAKSKRGKRYGWSICLECRKPKKHTFHQLKNLLQMENLPAQFLDCILNVQEPFFNDPVAKYGIKKIEAVRQQGHLAAIKVDRWKQRQRRKGR